MSQFPGSDSSSENYRSSENAGPSDNPGSSETNPTEPLADTTAPVVPEQRSPWQAPVGAPALPGETPSSLADTRPAPAPTSGVHQAPPSLSHAPYAGAHSSAFGTLRENGEPEPAAEAGSDDVWQRPASSRRKRSGLGGFVAVAAVAAVIGALVATGGYALLGRGATAATGGTSDTLSIGHYKDASLITAVAAKATPSVVTIGVTSGSSGGTGSGVILTSDGYIVTNTHVVTLDGASSTGTVSVTTSGGRVYSAKVIGTDPLVDLAVIKIDATGLTPITFADSSKLNVGDTTVAIGAPLGLSNTVTDGIVSTLNRSITVASSAVPDTGGDTSGGSQDNNGQGPFSFDNGQGSSGSTTSTIALPVIQTDASINPGNSGGALLDTDGKLIGINVAIASAGGSSSSSSAAGSIGVGFSIPSKLVERVANDIKDTGSATHGLLGASVDDATSDTSATQTGALIKTLTSGGAAQKAGLRAGDVVTKFDGVQVTSGTDLSAQVRVLAGGSTASLTYIRDGSTKSLTVTLGTLKG
ncbi:MULTISPECIES: S1C family serine protease [unclassified Frondihabitans]|uniref:S1C family serine protease n=1 Tax=unclassified Frondihabitans TaxID=2626248 RepID=UPI000F4EFCA0|nr:MULTISPECIES: trypsin-like peptidase domain-containing protein [unclassified Frondihabitans]RPE76372.1 putative serine protease PepD [Frondihabitans sp. PhB153]RPF05352.1 putative serine protease PepD [Frondihabitans sp. PhB161]